MTKRVNVSTKYDAVAFINPEKCVNCGMCRDYCPTGAISEKQKAICHLCPDCTSKPAITAGDILEMQNSACTSECPLGLSPQGFINLLKNGKAEQAFSIIRNKNPLPATTGFICNHLCQDACKRGKLVDKPMEIRAIQRYLATEYLESPVTPFPVTNEERIAVIGAGPAGLSAANTLASLGYKVTVFEQSGEAGGMLIRGIPDFRIDKNIVRKEIKRLEDAGIEIVLNAKISNDYSNLLKDYDKVVVAAGKQVSRRLEVKGANKENIFTAMHLMEKVNAGQEFVPGKTVAVIGGGNVAMDCARSVLRLGAEKVVVIYRRGKEDMPASEYEISEAEAEGIEFIYQANPVEVLGDCTVSAIRCEKTAMGAPDETGRRSLSGTGETFDFECDTIINALGQVSDVEWPQNENVVFAGDIAGGKSSVVDAMASGRNAAIAVDCELREREYCDYSVDHEISAGDLRYKIYPAVRRKINVPALDKLDAKAAVKSFDVCEKTATQDFVSLEVLRCLECGYEAVDTEKCIGCGVCRKVCPMGNVITMVKP